MIKTIYTRAQRIEENNSVQNQVSFNVAKELFLQGVEIWYFIEDYEVVEIQETDWAEDYTSETEYIKELFPMTCKSLDLGDTIEDLYKDKIYFVSLEWV